LRRLTTLVTAVLALTVIAATACQGPAVKAVKQKHVPVIDRTTHTRFPTNRAGRVLASRGGYRRFLVTAYSAPCRIQGTGTKTATGFRVYKKIGGKVVKVPGCAVDPRVIPLGSIVRVGGVSYEADDTGPAVKGSHIDLRLDSYKQAKAFGRRHTPIEIYKVSQN
jgi:3D (Asp-Asp-Asp) domain-containing protein